MLTEFLLCLDTLFWVVFWITAIVIIIKSNDTEPLLASFAVMLMAGLHVYCVCTNFLGD